MIEHMFDSRSRVWLLDQPVCLYPERVYTSSAEEQAALVALLKERPGGLSWPQLADAVLELGGPHKAREALLPEASSHLRSTSRQFWKLPLTSSIGLSKASTFGPSLTAGIRRGCVTSTKRRRSCSQEVVGQRMTLRSPSWGPAMRPLVGSRWPRLSPMPSWTCS